MSSTAATTTPAPAAPAPDPQVEALKAENAKFKADNEKREAEAKKAADKKKADEEGYKARAEALEAERDEANKKLAAREKADKDRREARIKALPDSLREQAAYVKDDKLDEWLDKQTTTAAAPPPTKKAPPTVGAPIAGAGPADDSENPASDGVQKFLKSMGKWNPGTAAALAGKTIELNPYTEKVVTRTSTDAFITHVNSRAVRSGDFRDPNAPGMAHVKAKG